MDLGRTQFLSLLTKAITTALGVIQSVLIVRFLSPSEFGVVGLVMSIGGLIGVSQHLGIVDGAIREIAILKNPREVGKVFWVSHLVRQVVTLPLSLGLVALAYYIAVHIYNRPEIVPLIQLYAAVLILQGLQDVLGATLTGMKQFVALYAVQIITAAINIAVFGYLTWRYSTSGFFWAVIITTSIMVALLFLLITRQLKGNLKLPTKVDIALYGKRVMRIGVFMYLSRIFFVVWQRLPILILGAVVTSDELGYLNVSLTFGSRLTIIAMALSEVNLAWMSSLYTSQREQFKQVVTRNMHRVLVVMAFITLVLLFFTPEILQHIIGLEYLPAHHLIIVMTLAFLLYALTDIGTSSIFVSADAPRSRAVVYGLMMSITGIIVAWLLLTEPSPLLASYAVLAGALGAYVAMVWHAYHKYHISLLTTQLTIFLVSLALSAAWFFTDPTLFSRSIVFCALSAYIIFEARRSNLLPNSFLLKNKAANADHSEKSQFGVICFAGAAYHQLTWTNRQHIMSRVSSQHRVLYIEPRVWVLKYLIKHWQSPSEVAQFCKRLVWVHKENDNLYIKAQGNLIPGSREINVISKLNHLLNRYNILAWARALGFKEQRAVVWLYDTEAAEYLSAFPDATVLYDCVDDHAAQAGVDRNPQRVVEEENIILKRADLVTVTSKRLFELKRAANPNTQLVLNAGSVELFSHTAHVTPQQKKYKDLTSLSHPILGSVGALDFYKLDSALIFTVASAKPDWHFVFIGEPKVSAKNNENVQKLARLPNVSIFGEVTHKDVPAYVAQFDLCLIPYQSNKYNEASFPLKFWEFMATGKPIVVSGVPELMEYKELIGFATTPAEFIALAEKWLANPSDKVRERKSLSLEHGWDNRVEKMLTLVEQAMRKKYENRI